MIGLNRPGILKLALNSDEARFNGSGTHVDAEVIAKKGGFYGYSHSATFTLPGNCCLYYEFTPTGKRGN